MRTRNRGSGFFIVCFLILLPACSNKNQPDIIFPTLTLSLCTARANFGDPADSPYVLPFPVGKSYRIVRATAFRTVVTASSWPMIL